ncbi:MAG: class I SAM-dependent methyltransferase [Planctomycetes bacterium]|nr:class I SAM-dependent methyltransferase [Planctomycetota bacterium]
MNDRSIVSGDLCQFRPYVDAYRPTADEVSDGWQGLHYLAMHEERMLALLQRSLRHMGEGSRVLDLGAFPGTLLRLIGDFARDRSPLLAAGGLLFSESFLEILRANGVRSFTVDLDPVAAGQPVGSEEPRYNLPGGEVFDLVIASEVLEHMANPLHLVRLAHRALRPGGVFLLSTPNAAWIRSRWDLLLGRSPNPPLTEGILNASVNDWRPHVRIYTAAELEQLLD